jgi:hypothetical protein
MSGRRAVIKHERISRMLPPPPPQTVKKPKLFTIPHTFTDTIVRLRIINSLIGRGK